MQISQYGIWNVRARITPNVPFEDSCSNKNNIMMWQPDGAKVRESTSHSHDRMWCWYKNNLSRWVILTPVLARVSSTRPTDQSSAASESPKCPRALVLWNLGPGTAQWSQWHNTSKGVNLLNTIIGEGILFFYANKIFCVHESNY